MSYVPWPSKDSVFALADCNNFYASCERVFQPQLNGKPVIVLSNNDGCVIARSNEAKALGIKMGAPYFQIERYAKQEGIAVFSSNYALYGDMSQRVMQILASFAPRSEVYSIDECFLDFTGLSHNLTNYSLNIVDVVKQWTGIPISIGIAPTKTLAKLVNRWAKKGYSQQGAVLDWCSIEDREELLKQTPLHDLWGISRRLKDKLNQLGIKHAGDLSNTDPKRLRQQLGVVMERMVNELRGISCLVLDDLPQPKQQIMTSRSFGDKLTELNELRAAVTHFATRAAEKCRQQRMAANALIVFIQTSPFDTSKPQYSNSATTTFEVPTQDAALFVKAALAGLKRIYRPGFHYHKAGVLLPDLWSEGVVQTSLFGINYDERSDQRMAVLESIRCKYGKGSLQYASELLSSRWHMKQQFKSPSYTTNLDQLWTVRI